MITIICILSYFKLFELVSIVKKKTVSFYGRDEFLTHCSFFVWHPLSFVIPLIFYIDWGPFFCRWLAFLSWLNRLFFLMKSLSVCWIRPLPLLISAHRKLGAWTERRHVKFLSVVRYSESSCLFFKRREKLCHSWWGSSLELT